MIVKDEALVIERCLASVLPIIDYYCIVDTGSSDDTIERIERFFHGKCKGLVQQREWKDFGYNREEALQLCKEMQLRPDYALFIDADEVLEHKDGRALTESDAATLRHNLAQLNCDLGLYKVDFDALSTSISSATSTAHRCSSHGSTIGRVPTVRARARATSTQAILLHSKRH
jgi:glycosyltransferase involved in cell wall biosynthesis